MIAKYIQTVLVLITTVLIILDVGCNKQCQEVKQNEALRLDLNKVRKIMAEPNALSDSERLAALGIIIAEQMPKSVTLKTWLFDWGFDTVVNNRCINSVVMGSIPVEWGYLPGKNTIFLLELNFNSDSDASIGIIVTPPVSVDQLSSIARNRRVNLADEFQVSMHIKKTNEPAPTNSAGRASLK